MKLDKLISELTELSDKGYGNMEVRLLTCDDNPINDEYAKINGAYVIASHHRNDINGVYIDGTVL